MARLRRTYGLIGVFNMKKLVLIISFLATNLYGGCIIRTITNNSTDAEIVILDVERPKNIAGIKKFVSPDGNGWSIQPKKHFDSKPNRVWVNWGAGAYKYIMVREKGDGLTCRKYCLLVSQNEITLKRRENCIAQPNEKCDGKNDDFPDQVKKVMMQGSCFIDLFLKEKSRTLSFSATLQNPN